MSKARNISNLFSSNTDITTDAELNTHATAANGHVGRGGTSSRPGSATQGDTYFNTDLGLLEVYDTGRWTTVNSAPDAPTSVTATNQPTSRAFNNGQASVAFTAPTTGGRVNTYTVTSSPGSYTNTGSSSPIVLTGLQSSTQYTYSITSTNGVGTSAASESSSGVTATTVPQAPTIGTATGADSSATLTFTAGSTGGATISNYKYSTDNSTYTAFSPAQTTSPLTISGLTNGNDYSFYLKAVNTNGDSSASSASNTVTIGVQNSYEAIATAMGTGSSGTITFSSIPQTYKHLQLRTFTNTNRVGGASGSGRLQFNGDTTGSNYWTHYIYANSYSGTTGADANNENYGVFWYGDTNTYVGTIIDILDYTNTSKKTDAKIWGGYDQNTTGNIGLISLFWNNTAAVNQIVLTADGYNFGANSRFALYGIKG